MGSKRHIPAAVNRVSVGCGHVGGRSTTRFGEFRLEGGPSRSPVRAAGGYPSASDSWGAVGAFPMRSLP